MEAGNGGNIIILYEIVMKNNNYTFKKNTESIYLCSQNVSKVPNHVFLILHLSPQFNL